MKHRKPVDPCNMSTAELVEYCKFQMKRYIEMEAFSNQHAEFIEYRIMYYWAKLDYARMMQKKILNLLIDINHGATTTVHCC